jgi:hypothetical protein
MNLTIAAALVVLASANLASVVMAFYVLASVRLARISLMNLANAIETQGQTMALLIDDNAELKARVEELEALQ